MKYTTYCDESRHDHTASNRYMAIGSLWVPSDKKKELTKEFRSLCKSLGLHSEIKWHKVSTARLDAYKKLIDFFFQHDELFSRDCG